MANTSQNGFPLLEGPCHAPQRCPPDLQRGGGDRRAGEPHQRGQQQVQVALHSGAQSLQSHQRGAHHVKGAAALRVYEYAHKARQQLGHVLLKVVPAGGSSRGTRGSEGLLACWPRTAVSCGAVAYACHWPLLVLLWCCNMPITGCCCGAATCISLAAAGVVFACKAQGSCCLCCRALT